MNAGCPGDYWAGHGYDQDHRWYGVRDRAVFGRKIAMLSDKHHNRAFDKPYLQSRSAAPAALQHLRRERLCEPQAGCGAAAALEQSSAVWRLGLR